jgi:hypothetical protein
MNLCPTISGMTESRIVLIFETGKPYYMVQDLSWKLTAVQLDKKFTCMEPKGSLQHSLQPTTRSYSE